MEKSPEYNLTLKMYQAHDQERLFRYVQNGPRKIMDQDLCSQRIMALIKSKLHGR